ncbi:MAG: hypothetical protein P1U89_05260 [Verrucomicrobiales bacterium]|nr:hypothetical protein [Verrucomicrobiales bacterium]
MKVTLQSSASKLIIATLLFVISAGSASAIEARSTCINAGGVKSHRLKLPNYETTEIRIVGDGDTDLDAFLYDNNGNLIDSDTDRTDYCVLSVNPLWTGAFRVVVKNHGRVYNCYTIVVD